MDWTNREQDRAEARGARQPSERFPGRDAADPIGDALRSARILTIRRRVGRSGASPAGLWGWALADLLQVAALARRAPTWWSASADAIEAEEETLALTLQLDDGPLVQIEVSAGEHGAESCSVRADGSEFAAPPWQPLPIAGDCARRVSLAGNAGAPRPLRSGVDSFAFLNRQSLC